MELSLLALEAVKIVSYVANKATDGALEKAGANLLDFLSKRFRGRLAVQSTESRRLEAAIISEAESNPAFKSELEKLVVNYQQIQSTNYITQNTEKGVNINAANNAGTVVGQQIQSQFRQ
ncbi:hypothetical protein [Leptolyngbya sp. BC1307]|uniref:hypothetical protein n=1 Tax=Leptolyngbya sp. BC1307 TaxID=2029589 RepID=UPI000EFAF240|nr:hypothetical protein [Leptolyngbya sp. BC1307]